MGQSVGLDFGTSTTFIALNDGRGVTSIVDLGRVAGSANPYLPSVAMPVAGGGLVIGEEADNRAQGVVRSVKRCITRDLDLAWTSGEAAQPFDADSVISRIIATAVERFRASHPRLLKTSPIRLGCPAMWTGPQRRRLAEIATRQGLSVAVQEIVDEPIAAGVGWVIEERDAGHHVEGRVLVVDIGGGTLDVAVLDVVDDGRAPSFNVLSADAQDLAGDDVDALIKNRLSERLTDDGHDPRRSPDVELVEALLLQAARELKVRLSTVVEASVAVLPVVGVAEVNFNRAALDQLLVPMLRQSSDLVRSALAAARMRERNAPSNRDIARSLGSVTGDVTYVLLTGGTSQIPAVRDHFAQNFPDAKVVWSHSRSSQQAVALGLAATDSYTRLNLHRPPFDLVAVYPDGSERTLYAAYTPMYEAWEVQSGRDQLGTSSVVPGLGAKSTVVKVICRDLAGQIIPMVTIGNGSGQGHRTQHLDLRIPPHGDGRVKLYVDGRLLVQAHQQEDMFRIKSWPVLRPEQRGGVSEIHLQRQSTREDRTWWNATPGEPG